MTVQLAYGAPPAWSQPFFQHALLAGTFIALASGLIGYFLVVRAQVFAADALSHVAFTGATAALVAGWDMRIGLFLACVLVALLLAGSGRRGLADDVVIGSVFSWVLGLGAFFLTLYTTSAGGTGNGGAGTSVLFGSIYGLSESQTVTAVVVAAGVSIALLAITRPLLFASLDEPVASARGVPVKALGMLFLALTGVAAGEATQAVGSLQLLGLLAAPAGASVQLTRRPLAGLGVAAALAVGGMWTGLACATWIPRCPPSFSVVAVSTLVYAAARLWRSASARRPS